MRNEGGEVCISTQKKSYLCWRFERLGLVISIRDGVLKMIKGSMVVMEGIRRNNLYYLKGSTVIGHVETFNSLDDGCTKVWQVKVGQGGERSLQAPVKKGSLEDAATCNLEGERSVLDKKKEKFSTSTHRSESLLDCVHVSIWGPAKTASLGGHIYFVSFIDNLSRHYWIYPLRQKCEALDMLVKWKGRMEKLGRSKSYRLVMLKEI